MPGTATIAELDRHRQAGFAVAFVNLGDANRSLEHIVRMAAFCRRWLEDHPDRFMLLESVQDIEKAKRENKLAVRFNIEALFSIGDQLDALSLLYDLGVRWAALVYNRANNVGSGVHDPQDPGLTPFGRAAAAEMDRIGMIKCLSHTGYRTAMDVLRASHKPCIFSHSNCKALKDHARNIPDELIRACATTGGVVGINGLSLFLGERASPQRMADHIDHVVQLTGIDHVGLGFDYGYLGSTRLSETITDTAYWPPGNEYDLPIECVPPEQIGTLQDCLRSRGYCESDLAQVLGGNMRRVASSVWR